MLIVILLFTFTIYFSMYLDPIRYYRFLAIILIKNKKKKSSWKLENI